MAPEVWFLIIIGLVIFNYLFSNILDYLNHKNWKHEIPFKKDNLIGKDTRFKKSFSTLNGKTLNGSISPNVLDPMKMISPNE